MRSRVREFSQRHQETPHAEERPGTAGVRLEARTAPYAAHSCAASLLRLSGAIDRNPRRDYVPVALPEKRATHPRQQPGPPVREFRALAFLLSQMSIEDRDVRQPQ